MISDLQKGSIWKRISAAMFDTILLGILIVGIAYLLAVMTGYDDHNRTMTDAYAYYEEQYGVTFEMTQEQYNAMTEEERERYNTAYDALCRDDEAMYAYNMMVNLTMLISTFSILVGFLVLEFAVPLWIGNGQTLGKKIFGISLMRTDGIRINGPLLFIRTILGKFTIETMIPVLIVVMIFFNMVGFVGTLVLVLILVLQIALLAATKTNSAIHDLLAKTVVVDHLSQRIFNDEEELIEYKKQLHAEQVARSEYK